jgi:hypothetical protein
LYAENMVHVNRFGLKARQTAVIAYILSLLYGATSAAKTFFFWLVWALCNIEGERVSDNHVVEFIDKWGIRWLETGKLEDIHGGGMPVKVPPELALEAVTLVKSGYETYVEVHSTKKVKTETGHHRVRVHRFYTSLVQALEEIPRLKAIVRECECTIDQLWQAMLKADPNLTKRRVYYRWALDKEDKTSRRFYGELLFNMWLSYRNATNGLNLFYRGVYIDECRIHLGASLKHGVVVICDKHDSRVDEIIETPWLKPHKEITLHFIVAVNPAAGLWYISMTTGTTPPIDNTPVTRNLTTNPYKVSSTPLAQHNLAISCVAVLLLASENIVAICAFPHLTVRQPVLQAPQVCLHVTIWLLPPDGGKAWAQHYAALALHPF